MRSFSNFNDIRFSAYRTAMKLRALQKRLCRKHLFHQFSKLLSYYFSGFNIIK
jgi:EF hand domain-containing protein